MKTLLQNGLVIDPLNRLTQVADVLIDDGGRIERIAPGIRDEEAVRVDATGWIVSPGWVDLHVHFRDPGYPEKETIESGSRAALAGGFTAVVMMPNTRPAIDSPEVVVSVLEKARRVSPIHVYTSAAITRGLLGREMTDLKALAAAGAVTFTDDGKTVMDPLLLFRAFETARELGLPISSHCEDHHFVREGAFHRGAVSAALGDPGIHPLGEELIIARDILMAEATGARLHIQHVSTARGVQLIREAKARGVRVTAEATPHHFSLTHEVALRVGTLSKVNPPLRTEEDVEAVIRGLRDGTIDAIATDHAPHTLEEKRRPIAEAPFGMVGLETCAGLAFTRLVHTKRMAFEDVIAKLTIHPARIFNLPHGRLDIGGWADVTVVDPSYEWTVDAERFYSKSRNTPFHGMRLTGKVVLTMVKGRILYADRDYFRQTGRAVDPMLLTEAVG
ncbi:MAG: dihydroorotase [Hydrogenibacillus schlegelii]|uniref:Dihydroorotase n=1 Tax=Hydrogenibacillus schlegelii TaxID=1484 RepID=A0A947CWX9_HYDSH|nr:dihydroorotase [Hydrogenibacillus schlegelii]